MVLFPWFHGLMECRIPIPFIITKSDTCEFYFTFLHFLVSYSTIYLAHLVTNQRSWISELVGKGFNNYFICLSLILFVCFSGGVFLLFFLPTQTFLESKNIKHTDPWHIVEQLINCWLYNCMHLLQVYKIERIFNGIFYLGNM
jgi:hypothetical protein